VHGSLACDSLKNVAADGVARRRFVGNRVRAGSNACPFMQGLRRCLLGISQAERALNSTKACRGEREITTMVKMNWKRAQLHGRPTLDARVEFEDQDRAGKWLATIGRRLQEQRIAAASSSVIAVHGVDDIEDPLTRGGGNEANQRRRARRSAHPGSGRSRRQGADRNGVAPACAVEVDVKDRRRGPHR
jgi:hypothetical protein